MVSGLIVSTFSGREQSGRMVFLALGLLVLLVVGILLAPLGAGIVAVTVVLAIAVVGWALWGLVWGRSRRRGAVGQPETRGTGLEHPEFLGPGGPDDPDRTEPVTSVDEPVETSRR
jgi:hypothetical protein